MRKFWRRLEKNFKYLVAALLVIVPLYPKFPFLKVPGIYVSIRFEDFLLLFLAGVTLLKMLSRLKGLLRDEILRAVAVFFLAGAVSLISGIFVTQTVTPGLGFLHLARRFEYFIPFLAVAVFFGEGKNKSLEFYLKTLGAVTLVIFLYGFGQRYLGFPVITTQNEEYAKGVALRWIPGSHINSTFAGHYDLASFLVLILPIFISLFFLLSGRRTRFFLLSVILSGFWLLVNSISRISFASYLVAAGISLLLLKRYREIFIVLGLSLVLSLFSASLLGRYAKLKEIFSLMAPPIYAQNEGGRAEEIREDRSTSIRLNVEWPRAMRAFAKNPLLGTGYSSIGLATDNDYLRVLGEVGILGLGAFILVLVRIGGALLLGVRRIEGFSRLEKGFVAGIAGGFIGILINAAFIDVFEASKFATLFWLLVGFAVNTIKSNTNG